MAQIDKIQVQSTTYDVAQSPSATFAGTSNDTTSPSAWTNVAALASGETNSSIFTKISKMFANIRWLYGQLGTTDFSGAGSTVSAALKNLQDNKMGSSAAVSWDQISALTTSQQSTSTQLLPTASMVKSMNDTLTSLNDAIDLSNSNNIRFGINDNEFYISINNIAGDDRTNDICYQISFKYLENKFLISKHNRDYSTNTTIYSSTFDYLSLSGTTLNITR